MGAAEQFLANAAEQVRSIAADMNECTEILTRRDAYREAFSAWAASEKALKIIRAEHGSNVASMHGLQQWPSYRNMVERNKVLFALMEKARARCAEIDQDWADEQESRQVDVEDEVVRA